MPEDSRLLEMVVRWEECREAGRTVALEELCRDYPELLSALRHRLRALGLLNAVLADSDTVSEESNGDCLLEAEPLPELPGYELLRELGRGGMGVVYRARQIGLKRLVALKLLPGGRHATVVARARFKPKWKPLRNCNIRISYRSSRSASIEVTRFFPWNIWEAGTSRTV